MLHPLCISIALSVSLIDILCFFFRDYAKTFRNLDVNGTIRCRAYKGTFAVLGRSSSSEKLYDMSESSMDEIGDFAPSETGGFIVNSLLWTSLRFFLPMFVVQEADFAIRRACKRFA